MVKVDVDALASRGNCGQARAGARAVHTGAIVEVEERSVMGTNDHRIHGDEGVWLVIEGQRKMRTVVEVRPVAVALTQQQEAQALLSVSENNFMTAVVRNFGQGAQARTRRRAVGVLLPTHADIFLKA